jgi:hypothetical protein
MSVKYDTRLLSKKFPMLFNKTLFKMVKIISEPKESGSNSVVFLLHGNNDYQYVLKITMLKDMSKKYNSQLYNELIKYNLTYVETEIYKIMKYLIRQRITPHMFQYIDDLVNTPKKDLNQSIVQRLTQYDNDFTVITAILNETTDQDVKVVTLRELKKMVNDANISKEKKKELVYNLLFQILYTLEVFNRIGIKHNDLHTKNIFVIIRNNNIFKDNLKKLSRKYIFLSKNNKTHEILLPDIGLEIRIYDFDRSCKQKNDFKFYPNKISSTLLSRYATYNQNTNPNESFDTYKILCELALLKTDSKDIFKQLIEEFFPIKELLYLGKIGEEIIDPVHKFDLGERYPAEKRFQSIRYYMPSRALTQEEMYSTLFILKLFKKFFSKQNVSKEVLETYNMQYIYKPRKESLAPILKATELKFALKSRKKATN